MDLFLISVLIALYILILLVVSFSPSQGDLSDFAKNRLKKKKASVLKVEAYRDKFYGAILGLRFFVIIFLTFTISGILFGGLHWLLASLVFITGLLGLYLLLGTGLVQKYTNSIYLKIETSIFSLFTRYPKLVSLLSQLPLPTQKPTRIYSKEEMLHLASESRGVLSAKEVKRIKKSLEFSQLVVESVMTPRSVVETVDADDLLGPLRLDELHKTGFSRFPVVEEGIDQIIGVVYIRNLLELADKNSKKARDIMDSPVHYIKETQTLEQALAAFLKTRHHLFVVVNEYRETVGVITLEDVIEELIGEKILDQFDQHDDLRVVATRNLKGNNKPKSYKDISE